MLVWSYLLDYENNRNPFAERQKQISKWKQYAKVDVEENPALIEIARRILSLGAKKIDSLHIACAISVYADYFLTTDDEIIKKTVLIPDIKIIDPIGFIKEVT